MGEASLFWGGVFCGVVELCWILALTLGLGDVRFIAGERASMAEGDFALGVGVTAETRSDDVRGGVRTGVLSSFGEYIDVVLVSLCALTGALFCLPGREGVVRADGWTGTDDVRRDATEAGVFNRVVLLPGARSPDLTVLDAFDDVRGFEEDTEDIGDGAGWSPTTCSSPN